MRRREVLRTVGVGALAVPALGRARAAHGTTAEGTTTSGETTPGETTTGDGFAPHGSVDLRGAKEAVVGDDGTTVYVAVTDGFAVVDVSDPRSPSVVAERRGLFADREGGPIRQVYDAKVDGDRLLVVGPAHPIGGNALMGAAVYDVSDPADPSLALFHETDYPIHNCFLLDGVAYLTGNDGEENPLVIVDVSGESARELGRWSVVDADAAWADVRPSLRVCHDVFVRDGLAYLAYWDAGTWLVDVSDPANPRPLGHASAYAPADLANASDDEGYQLPGNAHYAAPADDGATFATGREAWDLRPDDDVDGGPGGIDLYDASDPGSLRRVASIAPPPTPNPTFEGVWTTSHNFDFAGDRLYTSWYRGGVKVHDVSDPANPRELAHWRDAERASFWTFQKAATCAVASSRRDPPTEDPGGAAIFTFPALEPETTTAAGTSANTDASGASVPGFGAGSALLGAGLGAGAAALRRRLNR